MTGNCTQPMARLSLVTTTRPQDFRMNELTSLPVNVAGTLFPFFSALQHKRSKYHICQQPFIFNRWRAPQRNLFTGKKEHFLHIAPLSLKKSGLKYTCIHFLIMMLSFDARGNLNSHWKKLNPRNFDQKLRVLSEAIVETDWLCLCFTNRLLFRYRLLFV